MNLKKNKRIIATIASICITFPLFTGLTPKTGFAASHEVKSIIYSEDFETYTEGETPENIDVDCKDGSVSVKTVGTSKRLMLKNDNEIGAVNVSKSFDTISDTTVKIEEKFLQIGAKSSGNIILSLRGKGNEIISIETKDNDIVYKTAKNKYAVLVEDYYINKVYNISANVDLYTKKCVVEITGFEAQEFPTFDTKIDYADEFYMTAPCSPGFCVDDVSIYTVKTASKVKINGDLNPVIPSDGVISYEYTLSAYDDNDVSINNILAEWTLSQTLSWVEISKNGNKITLSVPKNATEQSVTLKGGIPESGLYDEVTISFTALKATKAKIIGHTTKAQMHNKAGQFEEEYPSYRVTYDDGVGADNSYKFSASLYNQFDAPVEENGGFIWGVVGLDGDVSDIVKIDAESGVLTVLKPVTEDVYLGLQAVSKLDNSVIARKTVLLSDYETYISDKYRMETVMQHIENSLNYGSDIYGNSPLIADFISIQAGGMGYLPVSKEYDVATSNLAGQNILMRAMINLSSLTNNDKYRNKVYEIYSYFIEHGIYYGLPAWGGHLTFDLKTGAAYDANDTIHELKYTHPFYKPLFADGVNIPYDSENGNGLAGYVLRSIVAGHCNGDTETLVFERHSYPKMNGYKMESVWRNPQSYNSDREGPLMWTHGASFLVVYSEIITLLLDYYEETDDGNALKWAKNCVDALLDSAYTYKVTDENGNPVYDENGKQKTWTQGIFNECITSTMELLPNLEAIDKENGKAWYESGDIDLYTQTTYGDRLYNNWIYSYGDDPNFITLGYCTEEEAELMLEPYQCSRENQCIGSVGNAIARLYDVLIKENETEAAGEIAIRYSKSIYNYMKLRYNFKTHVWDPYMSWIRPSVVRELGLNEYVEVGEDEEFDHSWYFDCANKPAPHKGYYYKKGQTIGSRKSDMDLFTNIVRIVAMTRDYAIRVEQTDPETSELLHKRSRFMWRVLRDVCMNSFYIGDIGEDLSNPSPDMIMGVDSVTPELVYGTMLLYKHFGHKAYIEAARAYANRVVLSDYNASAGLFKVNGDYLTFSSHECLNLFLELEALLTQRYEDDIEEKSYVLSGMQYDDYVYHEDGRVDSEAAITATLGIIAPSLQIPVVQIETDTEIHLSVGEEYELKYKLIPFDTTATGVKWEIIGSPIVELDRSSKYLKAVRKGETYIRCFSTGTLGVSTPPIRVIVE